MIIVSTGCPAGIGPEVSVAGAARLRQTPIVLVGDVGTLREAAELVGVAGSRFVDFTGAAPRRGKIALHQVGPRLRPASRRPERPGRGDVAARRCVR